MKPFRTPAQLPPPQIGELQRMAKWTLGVFSITWKEGSKYVDIGVEDASHHVHGKQCNADMAREIARILLLAADEITKGTSK